MNGFLLDTNVVSETMRSTPHKRVVAFLTGRDELWLSSILIHELEYGVQRLPRGQRRHALRSALRNVLADYRDRILDLNPRGGRLGRPGFGHRRAALGERWTWAMR